jgi:nucleoid-associated protein YgaU
MAQAQTGYQKAQLEIEGQEPLVCWFNPSQYAISKANQWHAIPVVGASLPAIQFGGGLARELTLELLFDAGDDPSQDVRSVTDRLFLMMEVAEQAGAAANVGRPPTVVFSWGSMVSFKAVTRRLGVHYTMFRPDGTPIRAMCALTLVQVEKANGRSGSGPTPAQNPTTRANSRPGVHEVTEGDSLASIAYDAYGDPTRWREIAQANAIDNPLVLEPGRALIVPEVGSP